MAKKDDPVSAQKEKDVKKIKICARQNNLGLPSCGCLVHYERFADCLLPNLSSSELTEQNEKRATDILRLGEFSFENVFDLLSLQDVVSTGQTCKQLLGFAQQYFKVAYQSSEIVYGSKGLFIRNVSSKNQVKLRLCRRPGDAGCFC